MYDATLELDELVETAPISTVPRAHLIGIAGAGMRSLADVLDAAGYQVSGSDPAAASLERAHFDLRAAHDPARIDHSLDMVVHSDAVPHDNCELAKARSLGLLTISYAQMLGRLMAERRGVAVAGTHGKSTTTAMCGEILDAAGLDPTLIVGATPMGGNSGGHLGRGPWMLAEACEYRANFLNLRPQLAALLNIEPDHFDCFATQAELEVAFARFVGQLPEDGVLVAHHECPATARVIGDSPCAVETFGFLPEATWQADQLRERRGYYSFAIRCRGRLVTEVTLCVPGRHNVANALAAAALASHCGAHADSIRAGLARFAGLRRRLQLLGEVRDVAIVDDYAHHPTEVSAALETVRQMFPNRRVWCVFQPHQASRLAHLLDDFALSLQNADMVVVAETFQARREATQASAPPARQLSERVSQHGCSALHLAGKAEIVAHLKQRLRSDDVVVTLGAGDIGSVAYELGQGLRTFRKAG